MNNNKTGKIVGGFLAGAGLITLIIASKRDKSCCKTDKKLKNLAHNAEEKIEDTKSTLSDYADQVMDFIVKNRPMVEGAISSLIKTITK